MLFLREKEAAAIYNFERKKTITVLRVHCVILRSERRRHIISTSASQ